MLRLIPIFRVSARSVFIRSDYSASVAPIGHVPFVQDKNSHSLRERGAEHSVAAQDSYAGLEHGNVAVEVFCPEPLAPQFHTTNLRPDAGPAVVFAPSSPKDAAEIPERPQGFIACHASSSDGLSGFRVLAGWDDGMGTTVGNGVVAFARVVCAILRDAT